MAEFKIIPDQDAVNAVGRDLHFHPSTVTEPATLTLENVAHFNKNGFVRPIRIFDGPEADDLRAYFDRLLEQAIAEGHDSYSISTAHLKYGRVYDLLTHPRIVACVQDLLGPEVVGWGSHFFCKMPGDGKRVTWHQDASYWPLTPSKTATMWLAIDDADPENANMRLIPGSHQKGHLTYRMSKEDEDNVLNQTVDDAETYGDAPVDITLKAGQASIHSDLLLHGSEANASERRRCGLTLRYCAADVRAQMGWQDKGIVVRGSDRSGHWTNQERPESD